MKNIKFKHLFFLFSFASTVGFSAEADSLIKIGNDLDLFAVLETFKNSTSIQTFEEKINSKDEIINNLDLNEDGQVDYIKVIDKKENVSHVIILRIDLNENQSQDIAVFEIEKRNDNTASIQIVGDVDLYGSNYIVEPQSIEDQTKSVVGSNATIYVNVWHWHSIQHIYSPNYILWTSPYKWHYYPKNWRAWKPYNRHTYYNIHKHHHRQYHVVHHHYSNHAHNLYYKHRKHSPAIKQHHNHHSNHKAVTKTSQHKPAVKHKTPQQKTTQKKQSNHNKPTKAKKKTQRSNKKTTNSNKSKKQSNKKKKFK
jgi:hypothetical protein